MSLTDFCYALQDVTAADLEVQAALISDSGVLANFTVQALEESILQLVSDLTGKRPDVDEPLMSQGLDSLAAMELRQKLSV